MLSLGPARTGFDVILLDPPYGSGAGQVALDKLRRLGWFAPGAWISLETSGKEEVELKGFTIDSTRNVGKAKLTLLRPDQEAA